MKSSYLPTLAKVLLGAIAIMSITGCLPTDAMFSSGLAREWHQDHLVGREQLIMEPEFYFAHLDQDIHRATWLLIPQGRLLRDRHLRQQLDALVELLESYIRTLDKTPHSRQLPERELAAIYLGIFNELNAYLDGEKPLHVVQHRLEQLNPYIRHLESTLGDAGHRRLNILVQTIGEATQGS